MKWVSCFSGLIRCRECRQMWGTTWNRHAPELICHECGGQCLPVGPQIPTVLSMNAIDGEMFRLEHVARRRAMS
jgi:hypothetical protein